MVDRLTDELWTSYLARYLALEGVPVSDYSHDFPTTSYAATENKVLTLERTIDLSRMKEPYVLLYDTFARSFLEERVFANFIPISDYDNIFDMGFHFTPNELVRVVHEVPNAVCGLLEKYEHKGEYDPYKVIEDLVAFAKDPTLSWLENEMS
jgi:hypothetical protein